MANAAPGLRIAVYSDLHLETAAWRPPASLDADLIVLAGDIAEGNAGLDWAARHFPGPTPIIYVPGNHEYYGHNRDALRRRLRRQAGGRVHLLDCDRAIMETRWGAVRILGCTLWTDFQLLKDEGINADQAAGHAAAFSADYKQIFAAGGRPVSPKDTARWHEQERAWLERELAAQFSGLTVAVTHHAPTRRSSNPRYPMAPLGPFFASDLETLLAGHAPALWIHGHTHYSADYVLGPTRIVSNQRGHGNPMELERFDENFVITLEWPVLGEDANNAPRQGGPLMALPRRPC